MKKPFVLERPTQIRMTLVESEALQRLKEFPEWTVFKKVCASYVAELQKANFWTPYSDPKLSEKHAESVGQAYGMEKMIDLVEKSGKRSGEEVVK
jgi:ABC-type branched-subunit amino acid transport system ATPase component